MQFVEEDCLVDTLKEATWIVNLRKTPLLWAMRRRRPSLQTPSSPTTILAFPARLMASYFLAILAVTGVAWTVHLWTGPDDQARIAGWLLSYLVAPPPLPSQ